MHEERARLNRRQQTVYEILITIGGSRGRTHGFSGGLMYGTSLGLAKLIQLLTGSMGHAMIGHRSLSESRKTKTEYN